MRSEATDIIVVGGGPAGLLAASACAAEGLRVRVITPDPEAAWPNRFGVWADELDSLGLGECLDPVFARALVRLDEARQHVLPRAYARVDGERLRARLLGDLQDRGGALSAGTVAACTHDPTGATLTVSEGRTLRARVVVDATGHRPSLVQRQGPPATAFQAAYGIVAELDGTIGPLDQMILMDWSDPGKAAPALPGDLPSFLYAMPLGERRVFVEETVLTSAPAAPIELLRGRLHARLAARGLRIRRVLETERCLIPMNAPPPELAQRTVGFGGAASMVHPATGYLVAHVARTAPLLAKALAGALGRGLPPAETSRRAWRALWPESARAQHAFYRFGGRLLLTMDAAQTRDFFDAFFRLPADAWRGYLGREAGLGATAEAMLRLYARLDPSVRGRLHRAVLGEPARLLQRLKNFG